MRSRVTARAALAGPRGSGAACMAGPAAWRLGITLTTARRQLGQDRRARIRGMSARQQAAHVAGNASVIEAFPIGRDRRHRRPAALARAAIREYGIGMPNIDATRLEALGTRIFAAMGAPEGDAAWLPPLLVRANLRGPDSHGVIRIPSYWSAVKQGQVDPKSPVTVIAETPVIARLDGGRGFGQPVARRGMQMAIAKAKSAGLSAVTLCNTSHVGRLADYAEMAAREGFVALLWVSAVHG